MMGMRWVALATLLAVAVPAVAADDPVAVRGRVVDAVSGAPVGAAEIAALWSAVERSVTAINGAYAGNAMHRVAA